MTVQPNNLHCTDAFAPGTITKEIWASRSPQCIGADGKVDNTKLQTIIEHETGRNLPLDKMERQDIESINRNNLRKF